MTVLDVGGSKKIVVSGERLSGLGRGPAFQVFDANGNFFLTRFVLNPDFTDVSALRGEHDQTVTGEEIVTGGIETGGLARGPVYQVWDKNGNMLLTPVCLESGFHRSDV